MSKVVYDFDPFELAGVKAPSDPGLRDEAMEEIAEFVKGEALSHIADGRSPVAGGKWKRSLSPGYKARKEIETGADFANMELTGQMLDALECESRGGTKLRFGIEGREAEKADGHNNHSGDSTLPPREFIPKPGQTFKREIVQGIRQIAEEFLERDREENG